MGPKGPIVGPEGPIVADEGCSPTQELEKDARRAAIFLVFINFKSSHLLNTRRTKS